MSGDEPFLSRWSRLKHRAAAPPEIRGEALPTQPSRNSEPVSASDKASSSITLPPIDSIESASDIKAFLAPGVPLDLARAALRRAWTTDPAIRDFIGLSENAWDFNAPGGVPGFGSLDLEDVRRLAAQVLGEPETPVAARAVADLPDRSAPQAAVKAAPPATDGGLPENIGADLDKADEGNSRGPRPRRQHGGALPR